MVFTAISYGGQYPSIHPRSPSDVASFTTLHTSLRNQLPELNREGDKILNEEALAKLVDGVMRFQRDHLGRKSKSKYWPTIRIPSQIFSDRSAYPLGPLSTAIISAYRQKQISSWRNFNFDNPKLFDDNVAIIKRMETDLYDRGYLQRMVFYFDTTVEEGMGKAELIRLSKIAIRFGATITDDVNDVASGKVTHIIAHDPEEHDTPEVIEEEERREKSGEEEIEKAYLKTLTVVNMNVDELIAAGIPEAIAKPPPPPPVPSSKRGAACGKCAPCLRDDCGECRECKDKKKFGGENKLKQKCSFRKCIGPDDDEDDAPAEPTTREMALVHWWYHPSSYDEWLPAEEVGEIETVEHPGIPNGPAVVGCKFIRDVEKYNEWGVESDYAVIEYKRKIAYLRQETKVKESTKASKSSKSKKSSKSSSKRKSSSKKSADDSSVLEEDSTTEPATKKTKHEDDTTSLEVTIDDAAAAPAALPLDSIASVPPSDGSRRRSLKSSPSTKSLMSSSSPQVAKLMAQSRQSSERRVGGVGMNPRRILTGIRGMRNEVIRRTVYDGALRVGEEPYQIVKEALADYYLGGGGGDKMLGEKGKESGGSNNKLPTLNARPEWRKMLPPTGFIRPSVDTSLKSMTVTELTLADESPSDEMSEVEVQPATVATYISVPILVSLEDEGEEGVVNMRGGGEENESGAAASSQQQDIVATASESNEPTKTEASDEVMAAPAAEADGATAPADNINTDGGNAEGAEDADANPAGDSAQNEVKEDKKEDAMQVDAPSQPEASVQTEAKEDGNEGEGEGDKPKSQDTEQKMEVDPPAEGGEGTESAPHSLLKVFEKAPGGATTPDANENVAKEEPPTGTAVPAASTSSDNAQANTASAVSQSSAPTTTSTSSDNVQANPASAAPEPSATSQPSVTTTTTVAAAPQVTSSSTRVASSSATPAVSSSAAAPTAATPFSPNTEQGVCNVVPLPAGTQLSNSLYQTSTAREEATMPKPSWYHPTEPSELEQRSLPEWFNSSAPHRTSATYITIREKILELAKKNGQQYITSTAIRRSVAGDAGSLLRLHKFLMDWGLLNGGQIGETAPSDAVLRGVHAEGGALAGAKRKSPPQQFIWTTERMHTLEALVVKYAKKHPVSQATVIHWEAVAREVGGGATPSDCQRAFIYPPSEDAKMVADAATSASNKASFSDILDGVRPEVINTAIEASLRHTDDMTEARKASFVAAVASTAAKKGAETESEIERTLMDIVDQRLQRLENRVALLDDAEAILEAERVSLELERRDMYTTRCRHWFGDGS